MNDTKTDMPWYIKVFSGMFAWLSGCFFLSFLGAAHLLPDPGVIALVLGIIAIYWATCLSQDEPGPFLSQASLALSVAGHFFFIASIGELAGWGDRIVYPVTCIILWAVLYLPTPSDVHRFFSTVLVWVSITLYAFIFADDIAFGIVIPLSTLATLFLCTTKMKVKGFTISEIGKPAAMASALCAFACLSISHWKWAPNLRMIFTPLNMSLFFGLVSMGLIAHFCGSLSTLKKTPHLYGVISIGVMSFFAPPGLMAAIAFGILGFGCGNTLLLGTATIFLPFFLFIFYYDLQVSLGWKSWVLAGSGALILLIRKLVANTVEAQEAETGAILFEDDGETGSDDGVESSGDRGCGCGCSPKAVPFKYHQHIFYGTCVFILFAINGMIIQKEVILRTGESVLLKLVPVDPRSLMQGDYMILRYAIVDDMYKGLSVERIKGLKDGTIIVTVDENMVATFKELDNGRDLAEDERRIAFKYRSDKYKLGAESFFFQEGHAKIYSGAKYGELKVKDNGATVLVGLRDKDLKVLEPPKGEVNDHRWMSE